MSLSAVLGENSRFRKLLPASSGNSQPRAQGPHLPGGEPSDNNIPCWLLSSAKVSSPSAFASYFRGGRNRSGSAKREDQHPWAGRTPDFPALGQAASPLQPCPPSILWGSACRHSPVTDEDAEAQSRPGPAAGHTRLLGVASLPALGSTEPQTP